jgi:D-tagatose-1,6-bisphosphate aldolase subunit GatZ/KbaZ
MSIDSFPEEPPRKEMSLPSIIRRLIALRAAGRAQITLLAVCPNSAAVLEAAILTAARNHAPMLLAATLNQVDRDGGYTGWTPAQFVAAAQAYAAALGWYGPIYPCLDHGGPWLKDQHTLAGLSFTETFNEVRLSLTACLAAGYRLLHIDPTVDRTLPPGAPPPIETVAERTVALIAHAEAERARLGLPPVAYEVGTEEVHGGLVDLSTFQRFLQLLRAGLEAQGLSRAWPVFIVGKVGTDLHTSDFDPAIAARLFELVQPLGSLIKGHYTDWVSNPEAYPRSGMGGANVGPEFTAVEVLALQGLEARQRQLGAHRAGASAAGISAALEQAVVRSQRWQKWLLPAERAAQPDPAHPDFTLLAPERRQWLVQTGARYVWNDPAVLAARQQLYHDLQPVMPDPHAWVVDRLSQAMEKYILAFNLFDALSLLASGDE